MKVPRNIQESSCSSFSTRRSSHQRPLEPQHLSAVEAAAAPAHAAVPTAAAAEAAPRACSLQELRYCLAAAEAAATAALQILLLLQLCCFPTNNLYLRGVKPAIPCSWSRGRWRRWRCDHLKTEHNVVGMHRTLIETYYQLLNHTMSRHNSPWSASFEGQKAS